LFLYFYHPKSSFPLPYIYSEPACH
jgi:hypothetical protein